MLNLKEKLAPLRSVTGSVKEAMVGLRNKVSQGIEKIDGPAMMAAGLATRSTGLQARAIEEMGGNKTAEAAPIESPDTQKNVARMTGYASDEQGNPTERLSLEERLEIAKENPANIKELLSEEEQQRIEVIKKEDTVLEKVKRALTGEDPDMEVRILQEEGEQPKVEELQVEEPKPTDFSVFNREGFDAVAFSKAIQYTESRGTEDPYKAVGPTNDLGKYQASPDTLNNWSEVWLGKKYTPEEFLNDPAAQEEFFKQYLAVADRLKLTPEQAAVAWHRGWGYLGEGPRETRDKIFFEDLNAKMDDEKSVKYLNTFRTGLEQANNPNYSIPFRQERNGELTDLPGENISQAPSGIGNAFSKIKDRVATKIPFMDSNFEKAIRSEVENTYPLTDTAKSILNSVNINQITSDSVGGLYKPIRGKKTLKVTEKLFPVLAKLGPKAFGTVIGETIDLDDLSAEVAMHEALHSMFQRSTIDVDEFEKDWELVKNQSYNSDAIINSKGLMDYIENGPLASEIYSENNKVDTVNEKFAYFGSLAAKNGIEAIPPPLRKYYQDLIK